MPSGRYNSTIDVLVAKALAGLYAIGIDSFSGCNTLYVHGIDTPAT